MFEAAVFKTATVIPTHFTAIKTAVYSPFAPVSSSFSFPTILLTTFYKKKKYCFYFLLVNEWATLPCAI